MNSFTFDVDNDYAKKHNELLKDTKRLQISAIIFGLILVAIGYGLRLYFGGTMGNLIIGCFGVMALISFALVFVIPRQVGDAARLYSQYELCPAIIAQVNSRDLTLLALVNINSDPTAPPRLGLATRTVTRIEGHERRKGERVPAVAVTGRRSAHTQDRWDEISPMPIAWATSDPAVIKEAQKAIPHEKWNKLEKNAAKLDDVLATRFNLLEI
ncbi:MAG: DUF3239 domain-containing protein [Corynebacterium sp.]|uniref:DUF3239 domain-containing protein n=1 Tax=Corynebacterium sp. TaxID=1720 RepID=UPI0026DB0A75|nr:DUF3239 domain-containing protein [Corynebacterium sp.]MDO5097363.1 DUF3239 domain-containing protein [Corynebacterium sp.]